MYKENIEAAGVSYPCALLVILFYILNMHENRPYTVTARLHGHCHLPCVQLMLFHQHGHGRIENESICNLQLNGFVMWKRGKVYILVQYF